MKGYTWNIALILVIVMFLVACADNGNNENNNDVGQNDPGANDNADGDSFEDVTITMYDRLSDTRKEVILEVLGERYPHITVEFVDVEIFDQQNEIEQMIAAESVPDIVSIVPGPHLHVWEDLQLVEELDDLIDSHNFDLSRLEPNTIDAIRSFSSSEGLVGLPATIGMTYPSNGVMIYNKQIFDQFGEPYPTDGMTWDDVMRIAQSLTTEEDGVHYYGFQFWNAGHMRDYLSVKEPILDPDTHEPNLIDNPMWRRAFDTLRDIYSIPGMLNPEDPETHFMDNNEPYVNFFNGNIAMSFVWWFDGLIEWEEDTGGEWDMVAAPTFGDGVHPEPNAEWIWMIPSTSENRDDAFRVLDALYSDEAEIAGANEAGHPYHMLVQDEELYDQVEIRPELADKNMEALLYHDEAGPAQERSPYDAEISGIVDEWMVDYATRDQDVVSHLRGLEETISQRVAELRGSK